MELVQSKSTKTLTFSTSLPSASYTDARYFSRAYGLRLNIFTSSTSVPFMYLDSQRNTVVLYTVKLIVLALLSFRFRYPKPGFLKASTCFLYEQPLSLGNPYSRVLLNFWIIYLVPVTRVYGPDSPRLYFLMNRQPFF